MEGIMLSWLLIAASLLTLLVVAEPSLHSCPRACVCYVDEVSGSRTANCSGVRFLSENKYNKLFREIEVLNVQTESDDSFALWDDMFISFTKLKKLDLSNCKINYLPKNVFKGLKKVYEINLSSNNIKHFDNSVFENTYALNNLNLRGNPLLSSYKPFISSSSLRILDLGYCSLNVLQNEFFHGVEKVSFLYLDGNHLQTIKEHVLPRSIRHLNLASNRIVNVPISTISSLSQLRSLNLGGNPVNCTCSLLNLQDRLSGKGIIIEGDVRCAYPLELENINWSKINENELCNKEIFRSRPYYRKSQTPKHFQSLKRDNYFEYEKYSPLESFQGDEPGKADDDYGMMSDESYDDNSPNNSNGELNNETNKKNTDTIAKTSHEEEKYFSTSEAPSISPVSENSTTIQKNQDVQYVFNNEENKNQNIDDQENNVENVHDLNDNDQKSGKQSIDPGLKENHDPNMEENGSLGLVSNYVNKTVNTGEIPEDKKDGGEDEHELFGEPTDDPFINQSIPDIHNYKDSSDFFDESMKNEDQVIPVSKAPVQSSSDIDHEDDKKSEDILNYNNDNKSNNEYEVANKNLSEANILNSDNMNKIDIVANENVLLAENKNLEEEKSENIEKDKAEGKEDVQNSENEINKELKQNHIGIGEKNENEEHVMSNLNHTDFTKEGKLTDKDSAQGNSSNEVDHNPTIPENQNLDELEVEGSGEDSYGGYEDNLNIPIISNDEKGPTTNVSSTVSTSSEILILPKPSNDNGNSVVDNDSSRQMIDLSSVNYDIFGPHTVVGCIIVFFVILVFISIYKGLCKPNKNNRKLVVNDVEASNGTELQDMKSLLPKTTINEEKYNSKYPNEVSSPETVNLIKEDKTDDAHDPSESHDLNQNDNKNEPIVKNGKTSDNLPPPIEITKAKLTILHESIPRTPIFVQKRPTTINNG